MLTVSWGNSLSKTDSKPGIFDDEFPMFARISYPKPTMVLKLQNSNPTLFSNQVCNLTDVDDKIIQRMQRDNIKLQALTDKFAQVLGYRL
jgi:hypothetical protein